MEAMFSTLFVNAGQPGLIWLVAGLGLGAVAVTAWQRLLSWREARLTEWDPY